MLDFIKNIFVFVAGIISIITSPFISKNKINPTISPAPIVQEVEQKSKPTTVPIISEEKVKGIQWPTPTPTSTPASIQEVNTYTPIGVPNTIPLSNSRSDAYWDFQIQQAEKIAKEAEEARKAREAYDQQCKELIAQRNDALAPIEAQIVEIKNQLWTVEDRVNERIKGTFTNESQRLRMVEAETHDLQNQLNKLQNDYNVVYSQYGSC